MKKLGGESTMEDDSEAGRGESLLPYDVWTEAALREVAIRALEHAAQHGLPGAHHFYLTFRTDHPGVEMPARLRAQYPEDMTIVLQHQFWDLMVDRERGRFGVGLSFSGIPSKLTIPFAALTAFADPAAHYGLRFQPEETAQTPAPEDATEAAAPASAAPASEAPAGIVRLDAFRKRTPAEK